MPKKATEEPEEGPTLEEGADPVTGLDRNSSKPRTDVIRDGPATAAEQRQARIDALERERAGYVAADKRDRVKAVDQDLKRLRAEADAENEPETTTAPPDLETPEGTG